MKKSLLSILIFVAGVSVSVSFQNCGGSSLEAASSDTDGLRVEVVNEDGDLEQDLSNGDGDGRDGSFGFNLGNGDNVFYVNGGGLSLNLSTGRVFSKLYWSILESHIYEQRGTTFTRDLPTDFCSNSAFPHCAHTTTAPCVGLGCYKSTTPVRCHWQKRMSTAELNRSIAGLNTLQFLNRVVQADDPMIADCNNPILYFYSQNASNNLEVSLADRACVPADMYYAVDDSGADIRAVFDTELTEIAALTNNQGDAEFCNNYSVYSWDTTKATYRSVSGFTTPENSYDYQATFEAQAIMVGGEERLAGMASLRFKEPGDPVIYCADRVPVQPAEIDVIFPSEGLTYQVLRTTSVIADAPTAEIVYEDPVDGGAVWQFFLDRATALTHSGGVILDEAQGNALRNVMETVLVNRAKVSQLAQPCPPTM